MHYDVIVNCEVVDDYDIIVAVEVTVFYGVMVNCKFIFER